jgi:hypothetical protein
MGQPPCSVARPPPNLFLRRSARFSFSMRAWSHGRDAAGVERADGAAA